MSAPRRWQIWALSFVCWAVYAVLDSAGSFALIAGAGGKPVLWKVVAWNFSYAYVWVLLTPLTYEFALRFGFSRRTWKKSLLAHIPFVLAVTILHSFVFMAWNAWLGWADLSVPYRQRFLDLFLENLPRCFATLGVVHAAAYYFRLRDQENQATRLEARLAQAQLEILRSQLEPHFLFNALNSIAALARQDPESAERMTLQLASLLRVSLDSAGSQEVALGQELEFLQNYIEIQRTRFRDRLTVNVSVNQDLLNVQVPSLLLQPLVENAIRHGIAKLAKPGRIDVKAARDNGSLRIEIADNGVGAGQVLGGTITGHGLRNTQARLQQLYGDRQSFRLEENPGGGCRVVVMIPLNGGHGLNVNSNSHY